MKNLNLLFYLIIPIFCFSQTEKKLLFEKLNNSTSWNLEFQDDGTTNYQKNWHLDGLIAKVENSKKGMLLQAGPEFGNDAHHMAGPIPRAVSPSNSTLEKRMSCDCVTRNGAVQTGSPAACTA